MTKVLAAWFLVASAAASPAVMPRDVVQGAVARVIATLEEAKFNQPGEALTAVGPNAERVRGEQTEFTSLFTDLLERSYVGKIETYSGEKIVYTGEVVDGNYATVRSRIITRRRTDTALDYRMHEIDGRWKVY